jgi:hypothetical protein
MLLLSAQAQWWFKRCCTCPRSCQLFLANLSSVESCACRHVLIQRQLVRTCMQLSSLQYMYCLKPFMYLSADAGADVCVDAIVVTPVPAGTC